MQADAAGKSNEVVWRPDPGVADASAMAGLQRFVERRHGLNFADYAAFWRWSVDHRDLFWSDWWRQAGVIASRAADCTVSEGATMTDTRWFPGARLNYAENLLRFRDARDALVFRGEDGGETRLSFAELYRRTERLAAALHALGVGPGDRVAAIIPNIPEAVVGMLATSWLGGVWSSCSPDFGVQGVLDRFGQIEPAVLIAADGYRFKGRRIDIRDKVRAVLHGLPGCRQGVLVGWQGLGPVDGCVAWDDLPDSTAQAPVFAQLPFDHPLYILFSSGTTGRPKCIVHGAGGTLLQHLKEHRLHTAIGRDDRLFYFTTCGWMMWNWLVSGLASGTTLVLFDGNPFHPDPAVLWRMADELEVSVFGTSARYLAAQEKAGVAVTGVLRLRHLRCVLSTGSPLAPASFDYLHQAIKPGIQINSISGGTDIVSCFALGNPMLPVRRGELQCRGLGMAVEVFDASGDSVVDRPGELVCTRPFPSMPVGFWNDADGRRYRAAYFERFPGVWTHGDWTLLTRDGGLIIEGRSDAVLNPGGVRIGTAEIYQLVDSLPRIVESVCIGQPWEDDIRIVLFVVLRDGDVLDDELRLEIREVLRHGASPRHVPAKVLQVTDIPRTRSGKLSELAVRDSVIGRALTNVGALANPEALDQFRGREELSRA